MPRPSQCGACGLYDSCLFPQEPHCAERLERGYTPTFKPAAIKADPLGRLKAVVEAALPAINVLTLTGTCTSKVTIVGEDGSRIWIGCGEPEGHYHAAISTPHRNHFGGPRDVDITWGDE